MKKYIFLFLFIISPLSALAQTCDEIESITISTGSYTLPVGGDSPACGDCCSITDPAFVDADFTPSGGMLIIGEISNPLAYPLLSSYTFEPVDTVNLVEILTSIYQETDLSAVLTGFLSLFGAWFLPLIGIFALWWVIKKIPQIIKQWRK